MRFEDRLYETSPASSWNSAYPLGNGTIGAMLDGGIQSSTYYLNDGGFWAGSGEPTYRSNDVFPKIKKCVLDNNLTEAEELLWKNVYGEYAESYLPLCSIHIDRNIKNSDTYARVLDISKGLHTVTFDGFKEECFASHVSKILCISQELSKDIVSDIYLSADVKNDIEYSVVNGVGIIKMHALAPSHMDPVGHPQAEPVIYDDNKPGTRAYVELRIVTDGNILSTDKGIKIDKATSINIVMADSLSTRDNDLIARVNDTLDKALKREYSDIKSEHIADFASLYNRATLSLTSSSLDDSITTSTGLKKYYKHPSMANLIFDYGRYLMISASREDSNCMNLQGIWNADFKPPWSSAFTVNINIEMNYWIAESTNLSECHMPLMRQLKVMEASGRRTASEQLHTKGWCVGHNSDLQGHTNLTGRISTFNPSMYALFISGGAWLATHIYTHFAYTNDIDFLKEYYYILHGAAEFYMDYAVQDNESNYLVLCPGSSPENTYNNNGRHSISKNATMDSSIARHIFEIVLKVGDIVGEDTEFMAKCKDTMERLYPLKIGKNGGIMEWYGDYKETEKAHRHTSHLYGLYPGHEISLDNDEKFAKAALTTIKRRGSKGIGWSLAWKTCMLARLHESKRAFKVVCQKLRYYNPKYAGVNYGGCYDNLFCAPPMQVDGNFGITAGILEMLMSTDGNNYILPALPKEWANGYFKGFKLAGGYEVSAKWSDGIVTDIRVDGVGDSIYLIINGSKKNIPLGQDIKL